MAAISKNLRFTYFNISNCITSSTLHFFAKCITRLCKMYYTSLQYAMYCRTLTYSPPPLMAPSTKTTLVPSTLYGHQHQAYSYVSLDILRYMYTSKQKSPKKHDLLFVIKLELKSREDGMELLFVCKTIANDLSCLNLPELHRGLKNKKMAEKYKSKNYILF